MAILRRFWLLWTARGANGAGFLLLGAGGLSLVP